FNGFVETTLQALHLVYAARMGVIPRITRRLNEAEREALTRSGAVFIFSVDESGIKRWTDGLVWSPSRICGNFLVYREMSERPPPRGHRRPPPHFDYYSNDQEASSDFGVVKDGGLVKKTITITIDGSDIHLVSYYTVADLEAGKLQTPASRPDIMSLELSPRRFRTGGLRIPPRIE
ncbi:hypothetical protein CYLTODRAFT_328510, partial [Cylindrobasidium torrendii FP15055 ss-10]